VSVDKPLFVASPARSSASDGLGGDLGPAAIKGGILIFVALALGALLLVRGPESDLDAASAPTDEEQTDDGDSPPATDDETGDTTTTAPDATTTTTASEARPPGEVTVLVANGSGLPGVASAASAQLAAAGYLTADPDDIKPSELGNPTVIYYITGFEAEAKAVAEVFGLDPEAEGVVAPMPTPLPTQDESLGAANILAVIGPDVTPEDPGTTGTTAATGDTTATAAGTGTDSTVSGTVLTSE
jgi:hypothetical protein